MQASTELNSMDSGIFSGHVSHTRYTPKKHQFAYSLYMLALNLDQIDQLSQQKSWFGQKWFNPLRFRQADYLQS